MAHFTIFFLQYARNIHTESISIRKFLRWVLLASERAPASPTSTASPLARAPPFTAMLQNSRCRESVTFPIRKFFRSDVERIESAFPCLLGLTILLLHPIFVSKKSNGKWKAQNKFVQFVQFVVKKSNPSTLPFREGQGVGFPLTKREARLTKRACERLTKREARLTHKKGVPSVSGVSGVSGVSFRFWTKKTPVFGPNRNKTGVSSVSSVSGVPQSLLPSL